MSETNKILKDVPKLIEATKENEKDFDSIVVISSDLSKETFTGKETVEKSIKFDNTTKSSVHFFVVDSAPSSRLIYSPTGPLTRDYDDVRRFAEAAASGITRAKQAGSKKPIIYFASVPKTHEYSKYLEVGLLGAYQALYATIQGREALGKDKLEPIQTIGVSVEGEKPKEFSKLLQKLRCVEAGRRLARDTGGADPERMSPLNLAKYLVEAFKGQKRVTVTLKDDVEKLRKEYPLLSAVARCSTQIARHKPVVVRLEYTGEGEVKDTLLFSGKGVTYDTGGADVKAGGHMAGMSRDKCGACNVAGVVLAASLLEAKNVKIIAELGLVRNSIGADSYLSDEIITSHAGVRVIVGNTDAEGRMVMADCLSHIREDALKEVNPRLHTCGTLTGHAYMAVGDYSVTIDNGVAYKEDQSKKLAEIGDLFGDCFEISRLRREDYDFIKPVNDDYDVLQCNTTSSVLTRRGHQFPCSFLIVASGMDKHGRDSEKPLKYSHLDIAGSASEKGDMIFGKTTASALVALIGRYCWEE